MKAGYVIMKKKVTKKNTTHRKSSYKNRKLKETRSHDIMDLDEDWDEDWTHLEEEADDDDWEEEFGVPVNKKLLSGMAAVCVLLLLAAAVLFALYSRNTDTRLEAVSLSVNPFQITLTVPQPSVDIQTEISINTPNNIEIP